MSIIVLSEKIFKDKGLYWENCNVELWKFKPLLNPVYDTLDHGVSCNCCTPIAVRESHTCPFKEDRNKPKCRGKPKMKGRLV